MIKTMNRTLAAALEAHGGLERWQSLQGMQSTIVSGGELWATKGITMDARSRVADTDFRQQRTVIAPFGNPGWTMRWSPEHIAITDIAGDVIAERDDPRSAFAGHEYATPWDPLHLAYFNGYAMWTYHALPFVLAEPGCEVADIAPVEHDGETLRGISARFADGIHTHSRAQRFYFGADGLLRRQDYDVSIWANTPAAHILSDYIDVEGYKLPTRRRAHPRHTDGSFDADTDFVTIAQSNYAFR
nr:hypothetical protein [Polymorphobacter sp.]